MDDIDQMVDWQLSNRPPASFTCPGCQTSANVPTVVCDCGWSAAGEAGETL